jgi:Dehydrogenases with different specificities (related to short-chain alcohol dehydrogenases)
MNAISFSGQTAIITGAGRGLGRAYALELAKRGAAVVVNDIARDTGEARSRAENVVAEIRALGGKAEASHDDISRADGGANLAAFTEEKFGQIDVLINNAGYLRPGEMRALDLEDLQSVLGIHLFGTFHVTLPVWKTMQQRRYGRIVMTSSSSSFGHAGNVAYSAAKAAMFGLTQTLALEGESYGIRVNSILPVATSEIAKDNPLGGVAHGPLAQALVKLGDRRPPSSVAHIVAYLASRDCSVSGHSYSAIAGRYARAFIGVTQGWLAEDGSKVTAEAIADHIGEIDDLDHFSVPASLVAEIQAVAEQLP